jgi:hypothetical protein
VPVFVGESQSRQSLLLHFLGFDYDNRRQNARQAVLATA